MHDMWYDIIVLQGENEFQVKWFHENLTSNKLISVKFPPYKDNKSDVLSIRGLSEQKQWRANIQNDSFVVILGWKYYYQTVHIA